MSGDSLSWPPIMPSWAYRDPAKIAEQRDAARVSRETIHAPAPVARPARDRHYTQARRLHIQNLMRTRR